MKREISGFAGWAAATTLLGAFLLFQIQPVISKMILPWFGGSPAVWTTCLLFFQVVLLAGYAYAHGLGRWNSPARQSLAHLALLVVAICLLPIIPDAAWKPAGDTHPTTAILWLLTAHVGLPYLLLSATSPLLQAWFSQVYGDRSPYRLYALSNIGSLGALLSYPFLVEPQLTTRAQAWIWSGLFAAFTASCGVLTWKLWRGGPAHPHRGQAKRQVTAGNMPPRLRQRVAWVALPALACVLLMAVTNHLCQRVAVVPMLWVVPLSLYLLTFIICFDREAWYSRIGFSLAAVLLVLAATYLGMSGYLNSYFDRQGLGLQWRTWTGNLLLQIAVYSAALFALCMVCHGELARCKPPPRWLTSFYLSVATGGAAGGLFVALICPSVFSSFFELNLGLLIGFVVALRVLVVELQKRPWITRASVLVRSACGLTLMVMLVIVVFAQLFLRDRERVLFRERNFYGIVSIRDRPAQEERYSGRAMFHGDTVHGFQLKARSERDTPTSYYTRSSGVGRALESYRLGGPIRVGAIGLGAGTIAAYGRPGDVYRFYEIDPLVIRLAQRWFTFLKDSGAKIELVPGDARLSLERELTSPQAFDVLVLDAFSGDTIPVHLLTDEAFDIYDQHLKPKGVIAVHISNRYLNLEPVVARIAESHNYQGLVVGREEERYLAVAPSVWVLLTRNSGFLNKDQIRFGPDGQRDTWRLAPDHRIPLWTDQYNNLFQVLRKVRPTVTRR